MRTTLVLDDAIIKQAKHRAIALNISLSEFVNRTLRDALQPPETEGTEPFVMPTHGDSKASVAHEPSDFNRVLEEETASFRGR